MLYLDKYMNKAQAYKIFNLLKEHYPDARMILQWGNNFELLVAIILSAQCTDKKVNEVTAKVFPKYRSEKASFHNHYANYIRIEIPKDEIIELVNFAFVELKELEQDIKSTGFYHNKAKNVKAAALFVLDNFKGILPRSIEELTKIPGVGRKTANVFLGNAYGIYEGIAVDTHVTKQSQLLGLTKEKTPEKIEQDLMKLFDQKDWFALTYLLIEHGRNLRKKKSDRIVCHKKDCLLCTM
ncbi:MAG TPA: endonuclease III [Patescibacteria group bacterium]